MYICIRVYGGLIDFWRYPDEYYSPGVLNLWYSICYARYSSSTVPGRCRAHMKLTRCLCFDFLSWPSLCSTMSVMCEFPNSMGHYKCVWNTEIPMGSIDSPIWRGVEWGRLWSGVGCGAVDGGVAGGVQGDPHWGDTIRKHQVLIICWVFLGAHPMFGHWVSFNVQRMGCAPRRHAPTNIGYLHVREISGKPPSMCMPRGVMLYYSSTLTNWAGRDGATRMSQQTNWAQGPWFGDFSGHIGPQWIGLGEPDPLRCYTATETSKYKCPWGGQFTLWTTPCSCSPIPSSPICECSSYLSGPLAG
jgi:hypothetical protein